MPPAVLVFGKRYKLLHLSFNSNVMSRRCLRSIDLHRSIDPSIQPPLRQWLHHRDCCDFVTRKCGRLSTLDEQSITLLESRRSTRNRRNESLATLRSVEIKTSRRDPQTSESFFAARTSNIPARAMQDRIPEGAEWRSPNQRRLECTSIVFINVPRA